MLLNLIIGIILGWVKFPLKNLNGLQTDKWHMAYYTTKISTIRCILDKRQPLTKSKYFTLTYGIFLYTN